MNKRELIRRATQALKDSDIRKSVRSPRAVFHISDDEGNTKDFVVKATDKTVVYTAADVEAVIDACIYCIQEALKEGEPTSVRGFGELAMRYRKPRKTKKPFTDQVVEIKGHYIPKFTFGSDLRMCAKVYDNMIAEQGLLDPPVIE